MFWIIAIILAFAIAQGGLIGLLHLPRNRASVSYGSLMLTFSLALISNYLMLTGKLAQHPRLQFLPVWYTLSFGPLLFYFVKFKLYPAYEFRWTDAKHAFLPLLQAAFYWYVWLQPATFQQKVSNQFIAPFFKTFEGILFLISFFSYLALAYRYAKFREATLKRRSNEHPDLKMVYRLRRLLKVLFILAFINTFYVAADFLAYHLFNAALYKLDWFSYLSHLSFAAMVLWMGGYGYATYSVSRY